jgi:hypothetical protein
MARFWQWLDEEQISLVCHDIDTKRNAADCLTRDFEDNDDHNRHMRGAFCEHRIQQSYGVLRGFLPGRINCPPAAPWSARSTFTIPKEDEYQYNVDDDWFDAFERIEN